MTTAEKIAQASRAVHACIARVDDAGIIAGNRGNHDDKSDLEIVGLELVTAHRALDRAAALVAQHEQKSEYRL